MPAEIKFCGLTRPEDARYAAGLGAAFVGVIMAGGPRTLSGDAAARVFAGIPPAVQRVGVFAGQPVVEIAQIAERLELSVVQLHEDADLTRVVELRRVFRGEIWQVVRVSGPDLPDLPALEAAASAADGILLDAFVPLKLGGTGVALPWAAIGAQLDSARPPGRIILAGGLRPENVAEAIGCLAPDVVDVSSGVESAPGVKDHDRMRAFRDAVTHASIHS